MKHWIRHIAIAIGTHPIVSGIAAVVSVLAGALASFFTGSIRASLALPVDPNQGTTFAAENWKFSAEAAIFWCLVVGAALLFAWSKYSDSSADNEHKEALNKKLHGLESMPPDAFLEQLAKEHASAYQAVAQTRANVNSGSYSINDCNTAVNNVLKTFARVVEAYDGHVAGRGYRLSLLLFSRKAWDVEKLKQTVNLDHLSAGAQLGTLESNPQLNVHYPESVRSYLPSRSYALPVHNPKTEGDQNVLPGAPQCFVTQSPIECNSVIKLLSDMEKSFPNKNQAIALRNFFASDIGRNVKSFVALPVPANKWADSSLDLKGDNLWGVVLIESNHNNMLYGALGFFYPVVQPILLLLSDIIAMRSLSEQ